MRQKRIQLFNDATLDQGGINLTPLIDVVFVVLIMFILVAPILHLDRIQLASGAQKQEQESFMNKEENSLQIEVLKDNSIWINKHAIPTSQLPTILQALYQKNPKMTPKLFHDKNACFGTYQTIKNALEGAGFEQLDIVLEPK